MDRSHELRHSKTPKTPPAEFERRREKEKNRERGGREIDARRTRREKRESLLGIKNA